MHEFKSSLYVMGKNAVYGVGGGFLSGLVLSWFLNGTLAAVLGILIGAAIICLAVYSNNIRVTVDGETVSFYRFTTLLHRFTIGDHSFSAKVVTSTGGMISDSDCDLTVTSPDGTATEIDCSMLGQNQFMELLNRLGFNAEAAPVETIKKGGE